MFLSLVGLVAPAEIRDGCIRVESELAFLSPPYTLVQGLQPQVEWDSPCTSQSSGTPPLSPSRRADIASGVGTNALGRDLHIRGALGHPRMAGRSLSQPAPDAAHLFPIIRFIYKGITLWGKLFFLFILFLGITFTVVQGQHPGRGSA